MVFYLKVNRNNSYVLPNLKHWIKIAQLSEHTKIYILCDNLILKEKILQGISITSDIEFIESYRDNEEMNAVLDDITVGKWAKIGQAHLTTFWHAKENGIDKFWNIDADDTFMCLDSVRCVEMFQTVEKYADSNSIAMMGLDMWRSISEAERWDTVHHWSFGVTYTDNSINWISEMKKHGGDDDYSKMKKFYRNVDWFFTYLREYTNIKIETFYFENLKFAHFFDYFLNYPHKSNFYHWKNGMIEFPIIKYCFGAVNCGEARISDEVIAFDIGIKDTEALASLMNYCEEKDTFWRERDIMQSDLSDLMKKKNQLYLDRHGKEKIVIWGTGDLFLKNYSTIRRFYDLQYVCDSNNEKWGKEIVSGVTCVSPDELQKMKNVVVVISVALPSVCTDIIKQLMKMGIEDFDYIQSWMDFVMGVAE